MKIAEYYFGCIAACVHRDKQQKKCDKSRFLVAEHAVLWICEATTLRLSP